MFVSAIRVFFFWLSICKAYLKLPNTFYFFLSFWIVWEEQLCCCGRVTLELEGAGIIFSSAIISMCDVWLCQLSISSLQRNARWMVIGIPPLLLVDFNHFGMDTTWLICLRWVTFSIFASSEHTWAWPHFSIFLSWFVQSYLCVWCTAICLHSSSLKTSLPQPDIIMVKWPFSQPLSLTYFNYFCFGLVWFVSFFFSWGCLIPCVFSVTQNPRMAEVGRDLWSSSSPTFLLSRIT